MSDASDQGASDPHEVARKGKEGEGWADRDAPGKGAPEKPQDEVAPGPGADGAVPKVG